MNDWSDNAAMSRQRVNDLLVKLSKACQTDCQGLLDKLSRTSRQLVEDRLTSCRGKDEKLMQIKTEN